MRAAELFTLSIASLILPVSVGCTPPVRHFTLASGGGGSGGAGSGAAPSNGGSGGTGTGTGGMDGGPTVTPAFVNGTRLHAHVADAGGGAVALEYWVDEQLNVPCQFLPTTDGKFHCAPKQDNSIAYSDSNCGTKVGVLAPCGALSSYVVEQSKTQVCQSSFFDPVEVPTATIYAIGQKAGTAIVYTKDQSNPPNCTASTAAQDYYDITVAELTTFVSATLAQEDRDGRLYAELLQGSDGTRQLTGQMYDKSMGDVACTPGVSGDEELPDVVCLPGIAANSDGNDQAYSDSACTIPIAQEYDFTACGAPQVVVQELKVTGCSNSKPAPTYFQAGTDVTAGNVCTVDSAGICSCHTVTDGSHYFSLGASIPATTFAPMAIGLGGTGQLQTEYLTTPSGGQLTAPGATGFWDTKAKTSCEVRTFSDGKLRCVPDSAFTLYASNTPVYSDGNCSKQLATEYIDGTCPAPTFTSIIVLTPATDSCSQDTVTATYAVGATYTGTGVWEKVIGAGCQAQAASTTAVYYALGAAIDPSTIYGEVTETTQ